MTNRVGQQLGHYRLEKLLGSGGFADVYLGQHIHLVAKQAAIKILHLSNVDVKKFQEEAETTEKLVHPHIVRLLDYAIEEDTPFLVLDFAPGGSLRKRHRKGSQLPLETVVAYINEIAPALQYAHDQNILHRDIKPDNMLVGRQGELLLSDFGIAVLSQTGRTSLEGSYGIGGTAYYMAPETFRGKVEKASDQYSLAVVVYEWLCGTPPFTEGNPIQLGYQHTHEEVPPLRAKLPSLAPSVEAVVMRALAKDPKERFSSVREFAEKFTQASSGTPTLMLSTERVTTSIDDVGSGTKVDEVKQAPSIDAPQYRSVKLDNESGLSEWSSDGQRIAFTWNAMVAVWDANTGQRLATYTGHKGGVRAIAWSPDGQRIASASDDMTVQVWDANTGQPLVTYTSGPGEVVAWSPDGQRIASARSGMVEVWDASTGRYLVTYPGHQQSVVKVIAWSPDGQRIASARSGMVEVWDASTGQHFITYPGHKESGVEVIAWSPDGQRIASVSDKTVQIWDASTQQHLITYQHSTYYQELRIRALTWSPDGKYIGLDDGWVVRVLDASTGRELFYFSREWERRELSTAIAWTPDGRHITLVSGGRMEIWDTAVGLQPLTYSGHKGGVRAIAWSPNGQRIASASDDMTVQVWDANTGQPLVTYTGHKENVRIIKWSPDGQRIASVSKRLFGDTGKTVQVWDANTGQPLATYSGHKGHVRAIAWSPDGRRIASASDDKTVQIWDASTGQHLISHKGRAGAIAWSPDGWRIASANGVVQIWDARTGQDLITYQEGGVRDLAWSPDGQHLILQGSLTTVLEVDTGHRINSIDTGAGFELLGWAPDGQHYAYRLRGSVYVDSVGRSGHAMYPYQGLLVDIAWVLNGWRIALVSYDGAVQVW